MVVRLHRVLRRGTVVALITSVAGAFLLSAPAAIAASAKTADPSAIGVWAGNTGDTLPASEGSQLVQDPTFLAQKAAGRLVRGPSGALVAKTGTNALAAPYPSSFNLSQSYSPSIVEPEGAGWDDAHHGFTDANYWNMCSAGAATAAISYFRPSNITSWPAGTFTEPPNPWHQSSTYWRSSDTGSSSDTGNGYSTVGRAYLMYIAEQVRPPSVSHTGLIKFDHYPTTGGSITDQRDVINWEISGHSPYYQNYFYAYRSTAGLTQASFKQAVQTTLVDGRAPLVLAVNTWVSASRHLPNWGRNVAHSITLIGYSDLAGTYRYVDTCGRNCGSLSNGGVHDIAQSQLYALLINLGYGFLY